MTGEQSSRVQEGRDEPGGRTALKRLGRWSSGLALIAAVLLTLMVGLSITAPQAEAATWHTRLSASGHHGRTCGPVTLYGSRETRLKYWTARVWDAEDDADDDDGGEWEYDWVKFKLVRSDTGETIKTFGPYYRPTGNLAWHSVAIELPSGSHPYKIRVSCDDARWGFKLQQYN